MSDWKPTVIGRPFLLFFSSISILLIILIEALVQTSKRNTGLVFGRVSDGGGGGLEMLSGGDKFGYLYLPTLISVLYGLLWTWIDHDIKRLEPYYQLSKPGGALARDSLLLNYPYALVASVPITAFKRKHWSVFYSGTILVLIFFFVSPLSSAVFSIKIISRTVSAPFKLASIVPAGQQNSSLSASFTFVAYDYTYFNASLPRFAAPEFAILPFRPAETATPKPNETWTGTSTRLSADLKCAPATIRPIIDGREFSGPASFLFTNEAKDCSYNLTRKTIAYDQTFPFSETWNTLFVSHGRNPRFVPPGKMQDVYALTSQATRCPNNHTFLALWGREQKFPGLNSTVLSQRSPMKWYSDDWAVIFCEPVYEQQQVTVTVQASTGAVLSVKPLGEKTPFTAINATYFEDLMSVGVNAAVTAVMDVAIHPNAVGEYPFAPPDHRFQLGRRFNDSIGIYNVHGLTGFGLAGEKEGELESMLDPTKLGAMFARAYRLLFAMAVVGELSNFNHTAAADSSFTRTFRAEAVTVNSIFARLVEVSIGIVVLLSFGLLYTTWSRKCNLAHDPSSIAAGMTAIAGSPDMISDLEDSEWIGEEKLVSTLRKSDRRYHLISLPTGGHRLMRLNPTIYKTQLEADQEQKLLDSDNSITKKIENLALDSNASHWELHPVMGITVCTLFLALMVLLGWLYGSDRKRDGELAPVTHSLTGYHSATLLTNAGLPVIGNSFQNNIIYNYLPTFIAMFTEPFWVLLTRYAALVMPYQELHAGGSSPLKSITVNYDSKPPHFVTYRSFRARHFILAALSVMALASNFLAVAFGALFNDKTSYWMEATSFHQPWSPIMKTGSVSVDSVEAEVSSKVLLSEIHYKRGDLRQPELFYVAFANISQNLKLPQWTSDEFYFLPFDSPDPALRGLSREGSTRGFGVDMQCSAMPESQIATTRMWKKDFQARNGTLFSSHTVPEVGRDYQFDMWQQCQTPDGLKNGTYRAQMYTGNLGEFDTTLGVWSDESGRTDLPVSPGWGYIDFMGTFRYGNASWQCPGYFTAGWIQTKVVAVPAGSSEDPTGVVMGVTEPPTHVAVVCKTNFRTAIFNVGVDATNTVLRYDRTGDWEDPDDFFMDTTAAQFMSLYDQMLSDDSNNISEQMGGAISRYVRNDPRPYDWVNYLMRNLPGGNKPNSTWPPDAAVSGRALEKVYKLLFPIFIQRYSGELFRPTPGTLVAGQVQLSEARMEMSREMFVIAVVILGFFIIVGTITYVRRPGRFLSSLPTCMAVRMSTYYASNAIDDVTGTEAMNPEERARLLKRLGNKYGYGVYVGRDGKQHFGVDREPLVGRGGKAKMQANQVWLSKGVGMTQKPTGVQGPGRRFLGGRLWGSGSP